MRRPIAAIALISLAVLITLAAYSWRTSTSKDNLQSISSLLTPLTSTTTYVASTNTFEIRDKVAAILETRPLRTLIPLIVHFAAVLGPEWPILFLTTPQTIRTLEAFGQGSQPFKRMVKSGQVKIIELPSNAMVQNYLGISNFLASKWFWDRMEQAKHLLLFQTDSMLCANSARRVEDFLEYDFIGAVHPWIHGSFNGGLSLRNVTLSREVIAKHYIMDDIVMNVTDLGVYEDVWFWTKMKEMGAHFPSLKVAGEFSVDFVWAERPLGFHGMGKNLQVNRTKEIFEWCPEAALAEKQEIVGLNDAEAEQEIKAMFNEDQETAGGRVMSFGQET